jgi:hypothetical protein
MKKWIVILLLLVCQATATVEETTGGGIGPPESTGSVWPTPTVPSVLPYPVVPSHLTVTVNLTVPAPDATSYYTTPGKTIDYLVTVKNDGSSEVEAELTVIPQNALPGWFSWINQVVTIPGNGAESVILSVQPDMNAMAGKYQFEVRATAPNVDLASASSYFQVQIYDYASETVISGTGQFQLNKDVRSMDSGIKSNKDVFFSGTVDALVKNEYLVDDAKGRNPNFEQNDAVDNYQALAPGDALFGTETFKSSIAFGGIGAKVHESYNVQQMEFKNQNFNLHQTGSLNRMAELKTANNFTGYFLLDAKQIRPGQKSLKEREEFLGSFEVQRRIIFKEKPLFGGACFGGTCDFINNLNAFANSA